MNSIKRPAPTSNELILKLLKQLAGENRSIDKIQLRGPRQRRGITIDRNLYDRLTELIISEINDQPTGTVILQQLLDKLERQIGQEFPGILTWHILQVKVDLEVRGLLKISHDKFRNQFMEIVPIKKKELHTFVARFSQSLTQQYV